MDTQRNEFVELAEGKAAKAQPGRYILFDVGEEVIVKNYRFKIARVKVGMNELVLKPVGFKTVQRTSSLQE